MTNTSEKTEALAKTASDIAEIIGRYVIDEVQRDEQERAGDYIQQMRKNIKLTRKMQSRYTDIGDRSWIIRRYR